MAGNPPKRTEWRDPPSLLHKRQAAVEGPPDNWRTAKKPKPPARAPDPIHAPPQAPHASAFAVETLQVMSQMLAHDGLPPVQPTPENLAYVDSRMDKITAFLRPFSQEHVIALLWRAEGCKRAGQDPERVRIATEAIELLEQLVQDEKQAATMGSLHPSHICNPDVMRHTIAKINKEQRIFEILRCFE